MAISVGSSLGSYVITGLIGAGGMGEVYRAKDNKLKRDVAIKSLPENFARDPERIARFQQEAEVLAALNHPNIAAIYSSLKSKARGISYSSWWRVRHSPTGSGVVRSWWKKGSTLQSRLLQR